MPKYNATTPVPISAIYPGDQQVVWNAEPNTVATSGTASVEVAIGNAYGGFDPGLRLDLLFSANPGAFSIALETADQDVDGAYVTLQVPITTATASGTPYYARAEYPNIRASFARVVVTTQTGNAVNLTATICR
jgi:hypothetical protein